MALRFSLILTPKGMAVTGLGSLLLLFALFALPNMLAASLDAGQADKWVRGYLEEQVYEQGMAQLKAAGKTGPDLEDSLAWQAHRQRIDATQFVSVGVKHFLFAPPGATRRIYVARVLMREPGGNESVRYFSLSAENNVFDFFWVNETSRWLWFFAF